MSNENIIENEKIIERTVASEMKKSYLDYAMSVIISILVLFQMQEMV